MANPTGINQFTKGGRSSGAKKKITGGFHGTTAGTKKKGLSVMERLITPTSSGPKKRSTGGFHAVRKKS